MNSCFDCFLDPSGSSELNCDCIAADGQAVPAGIDLGESFPVARG